uniref:RING-type domain-containing protein n=1 Tax=Arion vulgaris TaxID=1028688 RepID=A0A0B6ZJZ7_9EUPU
MGLCKCPKRKVTNLFCFEHKINVCEHCLVAYHSNCIVRSYLQWLQDSDYSPLCTLCHKSLAELEHGDCVRLSCYDVFHWTCLDQFARQHPAQTAPAGYTCPLCSTCIFPQANLASPVADALRALLVQVNWARAGLGLPLIEETSSQSSNSQTTSTSTTSGLTGHLRSDASLGYVPGLGASPAALGSTLSTSSGNIGIVGSRPSAQVAPYLTSSTGDVVTQSVISVDEGTGARLQQDRGGLFSNPRKLFDTTKEDEVFGSATKSLDHDEDKYRRRPAFQWLAQWFHSVDGNRRKDTHSVKRKFAVVILLGIIGFITMIVIFAKLGRQATEDDPFLDPLANPNIKVEQKIDTILQ